MTKIKTPDGKIHELTELDFDCEKEPWVEYKLIDGTIMKLKLVLGSIARSNQYNEKGEPYYFTQTMTQQRCIVPKELCKEDKIVDMSQHTPEGYR
jgi:hypothetical protein